MIMRKPFVCVFLAAFAGCEFQPVYGQVAQIPWDVQQDRPVAHDVPVWQGETVDLLPRLVQGTRPVAITNAPVEFRYREASLPTNTYRHVAASANTNNGVLSVRWSPDYDAGAAWYDYQIIVGSNAANPRCFGRITMRPTIGWHASTNAPPPITLYPTRADLADATGALATSVQALGGTVAGIGSNVVDLAAAVAAIPPPSTDAWRLVTPDGNEWRDATGGVWRVTYAPVTNISCTLSDPFGKLIGPDSYDRPYESVYIAAANSQLEPDPYPWLINFDSTNEGMWQVFNFEHGIWWGVVGSELPLVAESGTGNIGTATFDYAITYIAVTSRVDTVALRSDLAGLSSAWTNSLLYSASGTNYYPRWDSALSTYVVTGVPQ
jgi:hypothetical protein